MSAIVRYLRYIMATFAAMAALVSACTAQSGDASTYRRDTITINKMLKAAGKVLNPDTAIQQYDKIFRLSKAANYADGAFIALITTGIKYFEKQDYDNYRRVTYAAMTWAERSTQKDAVAWCLINIGEAWFAEGDYTTANELYYKALDDLNRKTKEITHTTANIYNCLGMVNMRLSQYDKALAYYNMAYEASATAGLQYQLAISCENKGMYYITMQQPDSAARYFTREMEIGRSIGKVDLVAFANAKMGKVYIQQRKYPQAIASLNEAIALARDRFNPPVVDAAYSLAEALMQTHKYDEAEKILQWAYTETRTHNYKDYYAIAYRQLANLHRGRGMTGKALEYMDSLVLIKDTLTSADKARAINHLEIKYKTSEKDLKLAENQLLIEKQRGALGRKNILVGAVSGGVVLLAGLFLVLYRNSRNRQRLQEEQIKSLQQENTIGMLNARVEGEEKERGRIARELHDGIGGMLSAAMMRLSTLPRQLPGASHAPAYNEAMGLLREMGEEVRKTSHNLMPDALLKQELPVALLSLCNNLQADGRMSINYQCYGDYARLTQDVKLNVYRIVQELLKNTIQHAHATHVLVQTVLHEQHLNITVEDNGTGFDATVGSQGIGLYNLEARVRSLNGQYALESAPGKGTTVNIELELT